MLSLTDSGNAKNEPRGYNTAILTTSDPSSLTKGLVCETTKGEGMYYRHSVGEAITWI